MKREFLKYILFLIIICHVGVLFSQTPPQANQDVDTVNFDTTLVVNAIDGLLSNDTGTNLTVTQIIVGGITYNAGDQITMAGGLLTINADGSYEFIPNAGFSGILPIIEYIISDGTNTNSAIFFLVVDINDSGEDLLEISSVTSCNQGYISPTASYPNGAYRIRYAISLRSLSIARDDNLESLVTNINLINDLNAAFDSSCIIEVENPSIPLNSSVNLNAINTINPSEFNTLYSEDWDPVPSPLNPNFETLSSTSVFNTNAINNNTLFPRQSISFEYCITVDASCVATNPIDFTNTFTVTFQNGDGSSGSDSYLLKITDFHTSETTVAANFFVPETLPNIEPNGTFDFTNTVIIRNDGNAIATNVNYNMGLRNFANNSISFLNGTPTLSSPDATINPLYDGTTNTFLLVNGQSLGLNQTITIEISHIARSTTFTDVGVRFEQLQTSMTQGISDAQGEVLLPTDNITGNDESTNINRGRFSYVVWDDSQGNHLDRYYVGDIGTDANGNNIPVLTDLPSSNDQCQCDDIAMRFIYNFTPTIQKELILPINPAPSGILEHKELTFRLTIKNESLYIRAENLQIQDDLNAICGGNIVSVSVPVIISSTAATNPTINILFDGITDVNIFDGISGRLDPPLNPDDTEPNFQEIEVEFKVIISDDCSGFNTATFNSVDALGSGASSSNNSDNFNIFSDTDNDGISNVIDIDDDNDGISDLLETNGVDPLADADFDLIPDYRDLDFGIDSNNDGIIDVFDFDLDGIPNHLDLDSDNDGIFDIVEAGNTNEDTNNNGMTNNSVSTNGLDDTLEDVDTSSAIINYTIPNNDTDANFNYLDIDSDNDGIVDIIEAQLTDSYITPNNTVDLNGIDTAYPNGLTPIDTDNDTTPDYLDTNTDDDARDDATEGWDLNDDGIAETLISNGDNDNDGLDNAFDNNDALINPTNNQTPLSFPNENIPITTELDWRELLAPIITIIDDEVEEGETLKFGIFLSTISNSDIVIEFTVEDETTTVVQDYEFDSPPIVYTIIAGTGLITDPTDPDFLTFDIITIDDAINEIDLETFKLKATVISGNTENLDLENIGGIRDNDPEPIIIINNPTAIEGNDLEFKLILVDPNDHDIPIANHLDINNINVFTNNDTAFQLEDYLPISAQFTIPAFDFELPINIITIDNRLIEDLETMKLTATYFDSLGTPLTTDDNIDNGIGTIIDNDFPNLFSPNGDGLSDVFEIIALKPYGDFKLQIFDRRGSEVYNYRNNNNPTPIWWNGGYKGLESPAGVYFYTLDYNDGITKPISGFIQLTR